MSDPKLGRARGESKPQIVIRANPSRIAADQASLIARKVGSPASIRRRRPTLQASFSITARSSGIPTDRLDRSVESIDRSTAFCASTRLVAAAMLVVFNGIVFSGVQFAFRVMAMAEPEEGPGGGHGAREPALVPVKVVQTAHRRR